MSHNISRDEEGRYCAYCGQRGEFGNPCQLSPMADIYNIVAEKIKQDENRDKKKLAFEMERVRRSDAIQERTANALISLSVVFCVVILVFVGILNIGFKGISYEIKNMYDACKGGGFAAVFHYLLTKQSRSWIDNQVHN